MNANDIDLDVSKLLDEIPEDRVVMYIRASEEDTKDFCFINGDLEFLAEAIASIMDQSYQFADIIQGANAIYLESK